MAEPARAGTTAGGAAATPASSVTARALALLASFDPAHPTLTLSQLARRSGLPLATAHRLLAELVAWGALRRREDGAYEVGRRLWQLGLLAPGAGGLRQVASPLLHDLFAATREVVHLAVRDGAAVLYVDRVAGSLAVPMVSDVGSRLPLHATAVGKVLLAHAPADVLAEVLADLRPATSATVVEPAQLSRQLAEVRRRGYAVTADEMSTGAASLAVPVIGADGEVAAAVGVVVPSGRRDLLRLAPALQVSARGITRGLSRYGAAPV